MTLNPDWRAQAACRDSDPQLFDPLNAEELRAHGGHPNGHNRIHEAISICRTCPVQVDCERFAEDERATGVRGGRYRRKSGDTGSGQSLRGKRRVA